MPSPELVIRQAHVIDPATNRDEVADIAVDRGRIIGIGDFSGVDAGRSIDATGMVASPG